MVLRVTGVLETGVDFWILEFKTGLLKAELGLATSFAIDEVKGATVFFCPLDIVDAGLDMIWGGPIWVYWKCVFCRGISQEGSNGPREAKASLKVDMVKKIRRRKEAR